MISRRKGVEIVSGDFSRERSGRVGCARAGEIHSSQRNFFPNIF
jgi:hypothetical protein